MFFTDWRALRRRWYAVIAGLLVTVGLTGAAAALVAPKYEFKATVVLVPPKNPLQDGNNPFLSLAGLHDAADVLSRAMIDGAVHDSLVRAGADPNYVVETDPTTAGPLILVTADGATPNAAESTLNLVLARLPVELAEIQRSATVPAGSLINVTEISRDQTAKTIRKSQIRAVVAAVAVGFALTVFGAGLLDSYLRKRRGEPDDDEGLFASDDPGMPDHRTNPTLVPAPGGDRAAVGNDLWPVIGSIHPPVRGRDVAR